MNWGTITRILLFAGPIEDYPIRKLVPTGCHRMSLAVQLRPTTSAFLTSPLNSYYFCLFNFAPEPAATIWLTDAHDAYSLGNFGLKPRPPFIRIGVFWFIFQKYSVLLQVACDYCHYNYKHIYIHFTIKDIFKFSLEASFLNLHTQNHDTRLYFQI